jgi:hypothetical protein
MSYALYVIKTGQIMVESLSKRTVMHDMWYVQCSQAKNGDYLRRRWARRGSAAANCRRLQLQ